MITEKGTEKFRDIGCKRFEHGIQGTHRKDPNRNGSWEMDWELSDGTWGLDMAWFFFFISLCPVDTTWRRKSEVLQHILSPPVV